jgi:hypothetical protein
LSEPLPPWPLSTPAESPRRRLVCLSKSHTSPSPASRCRSSLSLLSRTVVPGPCTREFRRGFPLPESSRLCPRVRNRLAGLSRTHPASRSLVSGRDARRRARVPLPVRHRSVLRSRWLCLAVAVRFAGLAMQYLHRPHTPWSETEFPQHLQYRIRGKRLGATLASPLAPRSETAPTPMRLSKAPQAET